MTTEGSVNRDGSVLDYCRLHDVTIQAWSPFQKPNWGGPFSWERRLCRIESDVERVGEKYDATPTMMAAAWILRHPAHMQLIAGTTHMNHMSEILKAADIDITREEWYRIYLSAGHILP